MDIERLKSTLATGGEHLGDIVFWALADARIDRVTLESLWTEAGLDLDLLPEPPTPEKALKLAVRETQVGQKQRLIRFGKEDEAEIVFVIVREHRDEDGNLSYSTEARITLDREREVVSSDTPTHDLALAIVAGFQLLRTTHTPDDIRRALVKALASFKSVTLRESGGIYWTPSPFAEKLRALQGAIERIGTSRLYLLPVHRSPDAERTLGEMARGSIEEELGALKTEIQSFVDRPPERTSTLSRRFEAFETLRSRASLYRDVLRCQVQDLDAELTTLAATVERMLADRSAA